MTAELTNSRWEAFARGVASGKSASEAYRLAGYEAKGNAAEVNASRLLRNTKVALRVQELKERITDKAVIDRAKVLRHLAAIGCSDITRIAEWNEKGEVRLRPSAELDEDTRAAVKELTRRRNGELRLSMHEKTAALRALGEHFGLFKYQDSGQTINILMLTGNEMKY